VNATLNSKTTQYYYYLHDKNGNIYYGKNYEEHKNNIKKYLKK
jgi:cell division protein YceG involved in septum cleavage